MTVKYPYLLLPLYETHVFFEFIKLESEVGSTRGSATKDRDKSVYQKQISNRKGSPDFLKECKIILKVPSLNTDMFLSTGMFQFVVWRQFLDRLR